MSKIVFAFACVALFQIANGLDCYDCDKDSCSKDMGTWKKITCGKAVGPNQAACLTHTYKDAADQKEHSIRKCVIQNKDEPYQCDQKMGEKLVCETCTSDLCNKNSAGAISLSFVAVSGILLALIAPKLYL